MLGKLKLFVVLLLVIFPLIGLTGCDTASETELIKAEDVEVVISDMENKIVGPFDKVRITALEFLIEGMEEGVLQFSAEGEVYPEKIEFKDGGAKVDELFTSREDDRFRVLVFTAGGQQVKELVVDIEKQEEEIGITADISPSAAGEKYLGFFVADWYSDEFDYPIYFDNWYIKDFDFYQQFNLLLFLYDHHRPAYYVDEFNNRYGTWEEYKVVGRDNLEEVDDFDDFFRKEGFRRNGILIYIDAETAETKSSLGYEYYLIDEARVEGQTEHFHIFDYKWKDFIEMLLDDAEIDLSKIGEKELDGEALIDLLEIRYGHSLDWLELEYEIDVIEIWVENYDEGYGSYLGEIRFDRNEKVVDEIILDDPAYFYGDPVEQDGPFIGEEKYDSAMTEGPYGLIFNYYVIGQSNDGHQEWLDFDNYQIWFYSHQSEEEISPGQLELRGHFVTGEETEGDFAGSKGAGALEDNNVNIPDQVIILNPRYTEPITGDIEETDGSFSVNIDVDENIPCVVVIFVKDEEFFGYLSLGDDMASIPLSYLADEDVLDLGELFLEGKTTVTGNEIPIEIDPADSDVLKASSGLFAAMARSDDLIDLIINQDQGIFFGLTYYVSHEFFEKIDDDRWQVQLKNRSLNFHEFNLHLNPPLEQWEDMTMDYPGVDLSVGLRPDHSPFFDGSWVTFQSVGEIAWEDYEVQAYGPAHPPSGTYIVEIGGDKFFEAELPQLKPEENLIYAVPTAHLEDCPEGSGHKIVEKISWEYQSAQGHPIAAPENIIKNLGLYVGVHAPDDLIGEYSYVPGRDSTIVEKYELSPEENSFDLRDYEGNKVYWDDLAIVALDYVDIYGIVYMVPFNHEPIRDINTCCKENLPIHENEQVFLLELTGGGEEIITAELVEGDGDDDNGLFSVSEGEFFVEVDATQDISEARKYSIRIKVGDELGNLLEKAVEFELVSD